MVIEKQHQTPNNHSAVLRFRSPVVGEATGIPFKKVQMVKCVADYINPVAASLAYSRKVSGTYRSDRSVTDGTVVADRWIAPPDLINQLSDRATITYGCDFDQSLIDGQPIISTIPMPHLMDILDYPSNLYPEFHYRTGRGVRATIDECDAYVSVLVPEPSTSVYRVSITGNELIIEAAKGLDLISVGTNTEKYLGIAPAARERDYFTQKYAKITPIDETMRKDFIYWATDKFNIYSLGRFATWRPGLLLDDLVKDIRLIEGWIDRQGRYSAKQHRS